MTQKCLVKRFNPYIDVNRRREIAAIYGCGTYSTYQVGDAIVHVSFCQSSGNGSWSDLDVVMLSPGIVTAVHTREDGTQRYDVKTDMGSTTVSKMYLKLNQ